MKLTVNHMRRKTKVPVCVTATWSGYRSGQSRVCHREYFMVPRAELDAFMSRASAPHMFSDNTCNWYAVEVVTTLRGLLPENLGYRELVHERFTPSPNHPA